MTWCDGMKECCTGLASDSPSHNSLVGVQHSGLRCYQTWLKIEASGGPAVYLQCKYRINSLLEYFMLGIPYCTKNITLDKMIIII